MPEDLQKRISPGLLHHSFSQSFLFPAHHTLPRRQSTGTSRNRVFRSGVRSRGHFSRQSMLSYIWNGLQSTMESRWNIREGYGGLMSTQLSVGRGAPLSGYIAGGAKLSKFGQFKPSPQRVKHRCSGQRSALGTGVIWW